ncbi:sulfate [Lasallia pustulata]|uniref:Sulfate n=1 Tax=Lasallia pustulata TaxID=136370 RepID=A0A1W5DDG9_9LECA|nr:sulfate [Lasallia pustulata]
MSSARGRFIGFRAACAREFQMFWSNIKDVQTYNFQTLRSQPLGEFSGSMGDLGTLLPILIALAMDGSISLSTTLVFSGVYNIITGVVFGVPLPVQPMKAIAAVVLSEPIHNQWSQAQTASAGLFVGGVIGFFSVTGILQWFTRQIPVPVIKGIQVGAGLSLILSAGSSMLSKLSWSRFENGFDSLWWAFLAFLFLLCTPYYRQIPFALILTVLGIVGCLSQMSTWPTLQVWRPAAFVPSPRDFQRGAFSAGLGQLPLTTLNSIIAVTHLSADLLPARKAPSATSLGLSVATMNLLGCWFGSMPVCHGSGGLAGQYRFGARSGASIIFLGLIKLLLGLSVGDTLIHLIKRFPLSLLGIMVFAAGLELAKVGESLNTIGARDLWEAAEDETDGDSEKHFKEPTQGERSRRWAVMLVTVGALLAFRNDGLGFIAGMLCHWSHSIPWWWEKRKASREGRIWLGQEARANVRVDISRAGEATYDEEAGND